MPLKQIRPISTDKETASARAARPIFWFKEITIEDIPLVGGKTASLGEMYTKLADKGIAVPNGFAVTAAAFRDFIDKNKLRNKIKKTMKDLDVMNVRALKAAGAAVRRSILQAALPAALQKEIVSAYRQLARETGSAELAVAVRSSATAEDLPGASFAGQQETYLNVKGAKALLDAVKKCFASLYTDRAISYRETKGFSHLDIALSLAVQQMVNADAGAAGVMFTLDTESGFSGVVLINASYGLGEFVVKGRVVPDQYYVFKEGLRQGRPAIISKILGSKAERLVIRDTGGTKSQAVTQKERDRFALTDAEVLQLARSGLAIEEHYGQPQDIEWVKDASTGKLYIVQARPETVKGVRDKAVLETYVLKKNGTALLRGTAVGQKIGAGKAHVIDSPKKLSEFKAGEALVTRLTDPDWEPIMRRAAAIVTEEGGKTSHAAIVSRELGVPCIVGAREARKILKTGQSVTVSCAEGDEGRVYAGILPFEVKRTELKNIPAAKTKIMMNIGDPDNAFALSFLPHDGVGLAREEFIFTNFIRIHPLALVNYKKLKDKPAKAAIARLTRGYKNKAQYGIDKLAEGIGRIAVGFHPKPVIVRLSDFKSNEYSALLGGREFEPREANPMLGWRGASRYYSKKYKPAFALECAAIKKARDEWGLTNIIVMVPFCRTPEEGRLVLSTMEEFGLKQGENGLKVYVMCEIPSNVVLADQFAQIFDGFSIGSNDLAQLVLGLDRDSALVSQVASDTNAAVEDMIKEVIKKVHAAGKPVGICGQAPSDHPEFADWLVRQGIDSISLNPDSIVSVRERIAYAEKTLGRTGTKTNVKLLSVVGVMASLAAGLMSLGAGCAGVWELSAKEPSGYEISPALLRTELEAKLAAKDAERVKNEMAKLTVNSFAAFTMDYPRAWDVEYWNGGVTVRSAATGEHVSIFRQIVGHPVAEKSKQNVTLGGLPARLSLLPQTSDGKVVAVYEIPFGKKEILEIDAVVSGERDNFLSSLKFTGGSSAPGVGSAQGSGSNQGAGPAKTFASGPVSVSGPLNHWDIRDRRTCVAMLTFARPQAGAQCQVFFRPCDVPAGWGVCDEKDGGG